LYNIAAIRDATTIHIDLEWITP